jgi:hypothetical protein
VSKCNKVAENIDVPLMMVSIYGLKRTLPKTVYRNESTDTSFDPTLLTLDSTFKNAC